MDEQTDRGWIMEGLTKRGTDKQTRVGMTDGQGLMKDKIERQRNRNRDRQRRPPNGDRGERTYTGTGDEQDRQKDDRWSDETLTDAHRTSGQDADRNGRIIRNGLRKPPMDRNEQTEGRTGTGMTEDRE